MRGCEIDEIAKFDESFAFQADFDPLKTMTKTLFLWTALCFRAVLESFGAISGFFGLWTEAL